MLDKAESDATKQAPILLQSRSGTVATLTLNRPQARNSLSEAMLLALRTAFEELGRDRGIHAIVLAANGPAFCAGHDLKELTAARAQADRGRAFFETTMMLCAEVMQAIVHCPKPVIAAVERTATAAGCQLVASCDLAVAAEDASFATPGVNIGLFCSTPMVALSRNVPRKRAMEMLLLGEMISARHAAEWGLVNRVMPAAEVMDEAMALAALIASKSPVTVAIGKEAFYRQIEHGLEGAYDYAARVMVENMMLRDCEEGIDAFIEKRAPNWQGS